MDSPALRLVSRRRGPADDKYVWTPFEANVHFNPEWWDRPTYLDDDPWFMQILRDGDEVARLELDTEVHIDHYAGSRLLRVGDRVFRGVGRTPAARCRHLRDRGACRAIPDRRLVAFSEEADEFWTSVGWERFLHATKPEHYRSLFVQPQPVE